MISSNFLSKQNGEVSASTFVESLRYFKFLAEEVRCLTSDMDVAMSRFDGNFFAEVDFCTDMRYLVFFGESLAGVVSGV